MPNVDTKNLPDFDDLPEVKGMPKGCAWGIFGESDEVGTLNLLTPEVVMEARQEIQTGESVQLDWGLENVQFPGFGRKEFSQKIIDLSPSGLTAHDDELHINTQSGSQWDSLRHVAHQATRTYYNGLHHDDVLGGAKTTRNGIHNWVERGGIVGRGVLIDWAAWADAKGIEYNPVSRHEIPVAELDEVAKAQGTEFKHGDILIVRTGFVRWHDNASTDERKAGTRDAANFIGVRADEDSKRWLWNHHFAAVAGDTVAFEAWPPRDPILHEWLLSLWGTPIGEMWNLEELSQKCKKEGRYTFFLTSAPLNVKGGVGSTPNAIAVF
ncbi:hypothetical protein YB2330_001347 [Saitoella coloradoensis]